MNKVVLVCAAIALTVFGGLLFMKKDQKASPYYIPPAQASSSVTPLPSVFLEPPTVDQIRKDLSGKTVAIAGENHQFAGPELNYMNIITANPAPDGSLVVDVQICADATIVHKKGAFRKSYTHEKVCGSLRVYYERKEGQWTYRMAENIDLQKMLHPNSVAPPSSSGVRVIRHN